MYMNTSYLTKKTGILATSGHKKNDAIRQKTMQECQNLLAIKGENDAEIGSEILTLTLILKIKDKTAKTFQ